MTHLNNACDTLPKIGEAIKAKLAKCSIISVLDLLLHLPFRYQDKTHITPIRDLRLGHYSVVVGQITKVELIKRKKLGLIAYVTDQTGILEVRFFHITPVQIKAFQLKPFIYIFGEIHQSNHQLNMVHPEYHLLDNIENLAISETLTPVYPSTAGLSQSRLRQSIQFALNTYHPLIDQLEWMTASQCQAFKVYPFAKALNFIHNPSADTALTALEQGHHPALKRLIIEELLVSQLTLLLARQYRSSLKAPKINALGNLQQKFLQNLPFALTLAQQKVLAEINLDLAQSNPMGRLVQGDVGSGKTIIAALAALKVIEGGYQVALMAPTELLSDQLFNNIHQYFKDLNLVYHRLSGSMTAKSRKPILEALQSNRCHLVIGTHALFQVGVTFASLGLIIIDEQHRFGVEQRKLLQQKGQRAEVTPHQLLMTATPIPRTLAMTQWAHLDLSTIDELPFGRIPIKTAILPQNKRELIIERLKHALLQKRQIYWVCTLIHESEKLECLAATQTAEMLKQQLPQAKIGLIHGRIKPLEKTQIMMAFKQGQLDILVATTVIEVGVDVPNASLMIIDNAERMGLAQLHQLRGRVGRGSIASHCLLIYQPPLSPMATERLKVMRSTTNGFIIAEKDLELRGQGEFLGTQQTGYQTFKIANMIRDQYLLPSVINLAKDLLANRPSLAEKIINRWQSKDLFTTTV